MWMDLTGDWNDWFELNIEDDVDGCQGAYPENLMKIQYNTKLLASYHDLNDLNTSGLQLGI